MRASFPDVVEKARYNSGEYVSSRGDTYGLFLLRHASGAYIRVLASDGRDTGWDHVSATVVDSEQRGVRCPTWEEMCWLKDLFFAPEECVVEFHPPRSEYVNTHKFVLHLWRNVKVPHETPPSIMV